MMMEAIETPPQAKRNGLATGMVAGMALVLGVALLPPFLPETWRAAVMTAFASVCHQMPARSPHVEGVQIAICDRCTGIYIGLLLGGTVVWGWASTWRGFEEAGRYVLLGALLPLGIDWIGPILGLWANTPVSRALTGFLFGCAAGGFVIDRLLRMQRSPERKLSLQDGDV